MMNVVKLKSENHWQSDQLTMSPLSINWSSAEAHPTIKYCLGKTEKNFWFIVECDHPLITQPRAIPGNFCPELWKYDVAELFLSNPNTGQYVEWNLAANSAWWFADFTAPRVASSSLPPTECVQTFSQEITQTKHSWRVALAINWTWLCEHMQCEEDIAGNVTAICGSPEQAFLSAVTLPGDQPNFHQPAYFAKLAFQ